VETPPHAVIFRPFCHSEGLCNDEIAISSWPLDRGSPKSATFRLGTLPAPTP
jgi:hypothetical protein